MIRLPSRALRVLLPFMLLLGACELQTQDPELPQVKPANHVVINEVFTLSPDHQFPFSWIEFYNPTQDTVNLEGWTLSFTTSGFVVKFAVNDQREPISSSIVILQVGEGVYSVPAPSVILQANAFLNITNNEPRMLNFTVYGIGSGFEIETRAFSDTLFFANPDTTRPDTAIFYQIPFQFKASDQIVLRDAQGNVVDVIRYGNYVHTGPGTDPFPNNRSVGVIPDYQSIARYNGAYFTGNTANDFYITGIQEPNTRPIPMWHSQAYKE